jgi:hypothetical protein
MNLYQLLALEDYLQEVLLVALLVVLLLVVEYVPFGMHPSIPQHL